jgi:hypothetical protein
MAPFCRALPMHSAPATTHDSGSRRFRRSGRPGHAWVRWAAALLVGASVVQAAVQPPPDADRHWAFQAPRAVAPPPVRHPDRVQTEVDRFILARLEAAGLAPAPVADPRTLLRRLSFDLTGLPPTPAEVAAFQAEFAAQGQVAVEREIDRLLASPRYGERWGRHWLDLARYSDTKGYVYGREERRFVQAPAYRDWVIQAFNRDLPYDRFLLLQIAGDQVVPEPSPDLAAMGFITVGRRFLGVTHDIIDDRIDVVTRTTLGLTVACARCHDHKYDPIPTADYYSLYGVFQGSEVRQLALAPTDDAQAREREAKYAGKFAQRRAEANARLRQRAGEYLNAQLELHQYPEEGFEQILGEQDLIPQAVRRWRDFLHRPAMAKDPIFAPWVRLMALPPGEGAAFGDRARAELEAVFREVPVNARLRQVFTRPLTRREEMPIRYGEALRAADGATPVELAADPALAELHRFLHDPTSPTVVPDTALVNLEYDLPTNITEELGKLQGDIDRRWIELGLPAALILKDRPPGPNPRIFRRGSPSQPGPEVPRQFLGVLAGAGRQPFQQGSGRLELAQAITDPANPLTARVLVNRVWQHHFGVGLVGTASDFGLRAAAPSHPELLDWLARRFIADGWSVKALHRLILRSSTYQTAHQAPPAADPDNRWLSTYPGRRLEFEQVRDAMLAVSGELDLAMGGRAVDLLEGKNRRRSVYGLVDRQFLPGVLRTFDFANPDLHVAVRHETTVPQQGLYFLNGPFAAQRARSLARRTTSLVGEARIHRLYSELLQRAPTPAELAAGLRYVAAAEAAQAAQAAAEPDRGAGAWRYGWGEFDPATGRVRGFQPLPHFTGQAWQGAATLPGGETGWAQLSAEGGHPGNTPAMACVRRWVAPRDLTVTVSGTLSHDPTEGDGVRAFVSSSRQGLLKSATVHHGEGALGTGPVALQAGDTLDFIVDIGGSLGYDQFRWTPVVEAGAQRWDAKLGFAGPGSETVPLQPWEQYAQVLLLTNEFAFLD